MQESYLDYHYQNLMPQSEWLFVTPGENELPVRFLTQECGHFFFDGNSYTQRGTLDSFELAYLCCDTGFTLYYEGQVYRFGRAGDVFFIDCSHGYRVETEGYGDVYFVHFTGPDAAYSQQLFQRYAGSPVINAVHLPVKELLEQLLTVYRTPGGAGADLYAQTLIVELLQQLTREALKPRTPLNGCIADAVTYLQANYARPVTLDEVAAAVRVSRATLTAQFRRQTGLSFVEWLRRYRIGKAKELLKTTELSLEAICDAIGVYDSSYLCRLFRKLENETPDAYRRRWRGNE